MQAGENTVSVTAEHKQGVSLVRFFLGIWLWGVFAFATLLFFSWVLASRIFLKLRRKDDHGKSIHRIAGAWARFIFSSIPGWELQIAGEEHLPQDGQPYVIVSNHESLTDIWAIYFLRSQYRWLSKDAVFKFPLVGIAMRWAGYVSIRRGDRRSHAEAMEQCAGILGSGISVLFFPEGTRSQTHELREFKVGAFKLAQEQKISILPIAITGTRDLLPKGSLLPGRAKVRISVLPPYRPDWSQVLEGQAEVARQMIAGEIMKLRIGTPP